MIRWAILVVMMGACASGRVNDGTGGGGGNSGPIDAPGSGAIDAPASAIDAAPDSNSGGGGGLDPELELPDPSGTPCSQPGRATGCALGEVCRYFTPTEGRCESCVTCGNLNAPCSATNECDTVFECYRNTCVGFCTLGTTECGAPEDCVAIGHATRGVCRP